MKKEYGKPMIVFESFKIATSIATACEDKVQTDSNSCRMTFGEFEFFADGICKSGDDGYYDENTCYHVPTQITTIFGS